MRVALIGDIHGFWSSADTAFFKHSQVDLVLFTGDLAWLASRGMFKTAEGITLLEKPFALVAGNHDGPGLAALGGEIAGRDWPARLGARAIVARYRRLAALLGPRLLGYSSLPAAAGFTVVGARPFAMEGGRLSLAEPVRRLFGVTSLEQSAERLTGLIQQAPGEVIVLAHNGPAGGGVAADDPFGADFRREGGDNGDPDLEAAVLAGGNRVRLVAAGHMHHSVARTKQLRRFWYRMGTTLVVNAARVPRHKEGRGYYLEAVLESTATSLFEVEYALESGGERSRRELTRFALVSD